MNGSHAERSRKLLQRGVDWLFAQQADDGGWHSKTYGAYKGGAALTALTLYTARFLPADTLRRQRDALIKGWRFLEPGIARRGCVACPDGTLDEPTYATALALLALDPLKLPAPPATRKTLAKFLLSEQCTERRGFQPDQADYGGWDSAGGAGLRGESPGTNISITRFVLESLAAAPPDLAREVAASRALAFAWSRRVQNTRGDGGFFFHPERDHEGNKAQWADDDLRRQPRSYGSATCDGALLLQLQENARDDARLKQALAWLEAHPQWNRVPGFEHADEETGWDVGLLYYYWMARARVAAAQTPAVAEAARAKLVDELERRQRRDGSWQNESPRMREDDPLIATCFALVALGALLPA